MSQNAQFLITVDIDSIDRLSAALREAGVLFDPIDDMTRIPQDSWEEALFTGRDLPHIIPIVNQHLEEQQHPRRIHPDHWVTDHAARSELLELLNIHTDWDAVSVNHIHPDRLTALEERHPGAVTTP